MKIHVILGTRPEIIKLAPVIHEFQKRNIQYKIIHTGQHYSENMNDIFWKKLELPEPHYKLGIRQTTHGSQTSEMLNKIENLFLNDSPDWVIVHGDTNSTLAGALAASKFPFIKIAHIEAGLRSFDRAMPEEINRIIVDHISHLLFTPTQFTKNLLKNEGIYGSKVVQCGNTIADSLKWMIKTNNLNLFALERFKVTAKQYVLLTIHRQENTNNPRSLKHLLENVFNSANKFNLKTVFPIHPRTESLLAQINYGFPKEVIRCEPLGFDDFLTLEKNAAVVATDSGGIQEECCILNTPCITLRNSTERPETVEVGANTIAGLTGDGIWHSFNKMLTGKLNWISPFGDGNSSKIIIDTILEGDSLTLTNDVIENSISPFF